MSSTGITETGTAEIGGARIVYEVAGAGHPLLLIHAGIADSRMWDDQWPAFGERYRTIRYDLPGYGHSQLPAGPAAIHEDVAALLRFLHVERTHIVGISFGGRIALDFTLTHPEMVSALVLVCPSVSGETPSEEVERFGDEEDALLEAGDSDGATELNLRMWVDGPRRTPEQVDPRVRERVREMQRHAFSVPMPEGFSLRRLDPPAIERLSEIRAPTLVIVGDHDLDEKVAMAEQLATEIRSARELVIHGVAHMVPMERPAEFNQAVLDFLAEQAIDR
jgi:pimeloyl-ACP methyl ester carboxylesterase